MRYPSRKKTTKAKIQRHSKVLSAVGTVKIYQPIPIVVKLKFKSVSRAHECQKAVPLARLSSLNSYHCPNYIFFFSCTKGIVFLFIGLWICTHVFSLSVMPCGFYTYVHLVPVTFPEKFLWSLMLVLNLGLLLLWIPVCISKIIKQNLWTLKCKYSFFIVILVKTKEKKKLKLLFWWSS